MENKVLKRTVLYFIKLDTLAELLLHLDKIRRKWDLWLHLIAYLDEFFLGELSSIHAWIYLQLYLLQNNLFWEHN